MTLMSQSMIALQNIYPTFQDFNLAMLVYKITK